MNKRFPLIALALCLSLNVPAQPDSVTVGLFITNLYNFDLADGSFVVEFWTWSLFRNDSLSLETSQEVTGSKKSTFSNYYRAKKAGLNWEQKKCTAQIIQDWDVRDFPFDRQHLTINMEDAAADTTALTYVADLENSKINAALDLEEWYIDSFVPSGYASVYNTTYGDPTLKGESVYPAIRSEIYMTRRSSWITFFKLVTGVYVAFFISLMVFRLMPPGGDSRIGLAVGGLFAAVGNKYIVESVVPSSTQTTLIDLIHFATFGAILAIVVLTIWIGRLDLQGEHQRVARLDRRSMLAVLFAYIFVNLVLILKSAW